MEITITEKLKIRFFEKILKKDCWVWTAAKNSYGYGQIKIKGRNTGAHRVSYVIHSKKNIPGGKLICHTCDNRLCVNPKHLYVGTKYSNAQDCVRRGRQTRLCGISNGNTKLTTLEIVEIRESKVPSYKIAPKYNVAASTIRSIRNKSRWAHLK